MKNFSFCILLLLIVFTSCAQAGSSAQQQYTKLERMIPMRDGIKLYTAIYIPKSNTEKLPFLLTRTPYSCYPYGQNNFPARLGPSKLFENEQFIFVQQDVRGRYRSGGKFEEVTPHLTHKTAKTDIDESSDAFDTIEWLLKHIEPNNGKVGLYGISYPGFYATAALPQAHPALKAVSPQAPVTDEFEGDDAYHGGAFFLMDNFGFLNSFDYPRDTPWTQYPRIFQSKTTNAYDFFLQLGPLKNANERYFNNKSKIWNEYLQHDTKDEYWQSRDIRKHLKDVKPGVLVVGGWYDAEDLFGALETYKAIQKNSPGNNSRLVMGPWTHGAWARNNWSTYGTLHFGSNTSEYFQQLEFNFFVAQLKGKKTFNAAKATIFETGTNQWRAHKAWPPSEAVKATWYLNSNNNLSLQKPTTLKGFDEYVSDPEKPVPYIEAVGISRNNEYMVADQQFASKRNDVLTYTSEVLNQNRTLAGPITADLYVTTTGSDVDFIVKLIEVLPDTAATHDGRNIGGMQRLVRAEVLRGKFRNSFTTPEPFVPGKVTRVQVRLNDVAHAFARGSKIMVQIQSSWFPLIDRNPQKFMQIPVADSADFQPATIRIHHDQKYPSTIQVSQLR